MKITSAGKVAMKEQVQQGYNFQTETGQYGQNLKKKLCLNH